MLRYLALCATFLVTGCNSLFYHPDSAQRMTPAIANVVYDDLTIPTDDGERLHVWRLRPRGTPKGVVVHFHGNAENMSTHFRSVYWLAARGYWVVTFDYRGYGKSSGEPERRGLVRDGETIVKWVGEDAATKDLPLFVIAQSLGGAVAVPVLAETAPRNLRALVLESTFSSYRSVARKKLSQAWLTWPFQYPLSFLVSDAWSPVDYIGKIRVPVLFIKGDADRVVPPDQENDLEDAVPLDKKELWVVEGGAHTPAFRSVDSPYREKLENYLTRFRVSESINN